MLLAGGVVYISMSAYLDYRKYKNSSKYKKDCIRDKIIKKSIVMIKKDKKIRKLNLMMEIEQEQLEKELTFEYKDLSNTEITKLAKKLVLIKYEGQIDIIYYEYDKEIQEIEKEREELEKELIKEEREELLKEMN